MNEVIYERVYTEACEDISDIEFLGSLPYNTDWFDGASKPEKARFSRIASLCAIFCERSRAKLTVLRCGDSLRFYIEAPQIQLNKDNIQTIKNLPEYAPYRYRPPKAEYA